MGSIYRGAWATIVALSSPDPETGLPRVSSAFDGICQQSFSIGDYELRTVMKTLLQWIKESKWATRAWTYQEAVLSARCLYLTPDQVYFECNAMQCCEALDETRSPFHNDVSVHNGNVRCRCGDPDLATFHSTGIFRDTLSRGLSTVANNRLDKYEEVIKAYTKREMTYSSDALNACGAVLERLEKCDLGRGFHWGLPIDCLQQSLLWTQPSGLGRPREGFPSWSWAGWTGSVSSAWQGRSFTRGPPCPLLRIWGYISEEQTLFLDKFSDIERTFPRERDHIDTDAVRDVHKRVTEIYRTLISGRWDYPHFDLSSYTKDQCGKLLLLEGILCDIHFTDVRHHLPEESRARAKIEGIECIIRYDRVTTIQRISSGRQRLLMIHRDEDTDFFLSIDWQNNDRSDGISQGNQYVGRRMGWVGIHDFSRRCLRGTTVELKPVMLIKGKKWSRSSAEARVGLPQSVLTDVFLSKFPTPISALEMAPCDAATQLCAAKSQVRYNVPPNVAENPLCRNESMFKHRNSLPPRFYQVIINVLLFFRHFTLGNQSELLSHLALKSMHSRFIRAKGPARSSGNIYGGYVLA
ncbi:hypothetical protein BCR34DRAFT_591333 [Clohesyomyces aquaticus]|uniref:Heterokaryon incompatibility domain-containing protein n=1 Tax=Clohesyomyces aquaticus TaxID=1231657 RepID=A0A1Y1Z1H2_9PLEO|nr:hypothetical protein BCR34DRAFT_591333 [Clohesyomyces aquaticus]